MHKTKPHHINQQRVNQPQPFLNQLASIFTMELMNWRWSWRFTLTIGLIAPLIFTVMIGAMAQTADRQVVAYWLTGNIILSLMFTNLSRMANRFAFMREVGSLDYFATLPIRRSALVAGVLSSFFLISLPAVIATIAFSAYYLEIRFVPHPLLICVLPLIGMALAGTGAFIGVTARSQDEAVTYGQVASMLLLIIGPVMIPPDRLPRIMGWIGWFSPATYSASALRQTLLGPMTPRFWIDIAALVAITVGFLWLVGHRMDWRQR